MKKSKLIRNIVVPVAFALLVQSALPVALPAVEQSPARGISTTSLQTKVTLEEAIKLVKKHFQIPVTYSEFTSGYSQVNDRETWSLDWRSSGETGGNFHAQVDVTTGEIIYISNYTSRGNEQKAEVPKYSFEEAKTIAEKLVNSILSDRLQQLKLESKNSQIMPVVGYGYNSYQIKWHRVVNGIPFPSNGVSVEVNAFDGTITNYSLNWSKESIPSATKAIDANQAKGIFSEKGFLELQYFLKPDARILDSSSKDKENNATIVYKLSGESFNGMIDALTGEPLKLKPGEWLYNSLYDHVGGLGGEAKDSQGNLTPEEQAEIDETTKLVSQEKAIESLKKWIDIPDSLTLRHANLGLNYGANPKRVWTLDWSSEEGKDSEYHAIYATVDGVTGEVLHFNAYSNEHSQGKNAITRLEAHGIADEFLKKIQPNRFQQVEYAQLNNGQTYPENLVNHDFRYERIVNGVSVPSNGFSVSVDSNTKKVVAYHMDFSEVNFPSLAGTLTQKQGESTFLKARPLELKYVQVYKDGKLGEIRLVYEPKMESNSVVSNMLDAKTGEFLDWQGKPVKEQIRPYNFKDIAGNFAEAEIKLLGQAGAFGEYNEEFRPSENVTVGSMLRAMIIAKNGIYGIQGMSDEELLKEAKKQGWLQEDLSTKDQFDRELLAKLVIRMMDLEKVAQVEGIFQAPYKDADKLSEGSLGYVALVKGLELMNLQGENFEPEKKVTRADAAYAIVKGLINR